MTGAEVVPRNAGAARGATAVIDAACRAIADLSRHEQRLQHWASIIVGSLEAGGAVLTAGNGGSATHAAHLAGELIGRFRDERRSLRAVNLAADGSVLTATGNDYGFEEVFARQVEGLATRGDVVVLFSTSGCSPNVLRAADAARSIGATVLAMTGAAACPLARCADDAVTTDAGDTASIQDLHHVAVHALCAEIDELVLAGGVNPSSVPCTWPMEGLE